jgi:restriction endonuclease Mrr
MSKEVCALSIPDFQTLMLPVLRAASEGEVRISDVVERLAGEFPMSAEERSQLLPSGSQTTFANRVNWAKSYLGKAGLVELTKRAHFRITEQGREVLAAAPQRIDVKYLNRFPSFQQFRKARTREKATTLPRHLLPAWRQRWLQMRSCATLIASWRVLWPKSLCKESGLAPQPSLKAWSCVY